MLCDRIVNQIMDFENIHSFSDKELANLIFNCIRHTSIIVPFLIVSLYASFHKINQNSVNDFNIQASL